MDWFNKKALASTEKQLAEAQNENIGYVMKVEALQKEIENLTAKLRGDRVCDCYCSVCKHGVKGSGFSPTFGNYPKWRCTLDCKCKDFDGKDG